MLHAPARISLEGLFALARTGDASTILRTMCLFATSREGYLVANGYALRGVDDDFPLVGPSTANGAPRLVDEQSDIVLARIGLAMVRAEPELQARPDALRQDWDCWRKRWIWAFTTWKAGRASARRPCTIS
jgi:hypothetical protein